MSSNNQSKLGFRESLQGGFEARYFAEKAGILRGEAQLTTNGNQLDAAVLIASSEVIRPLIRRALVGLQ